MSFVEIILIVNPIRVESFRIYSDSIVVLSWVDSYLYKREKLQNHSIFVQNRLHKIAKLHEKKTITYSFVSEFKNTADCFSLCLSPKQLNKFNYFRGPDFLRSEESVVNLYILKVTIPNPALNSDVTPNKNQINY